MYIVYNNIKTPINMASGFQKFIISLAVRICLVQNHPFNPGFLIIDEGFGCLDQEHLQNTIDSLNRIKFSDRLDWLLFISHIPDMQTIVSQPIVIERIHSTSFVKHE
jgi:DNA repair exonuclease SbcCD ATPase subunit